eukprot:5772522-Pleurochrysis_carterae.AAC.1
MAVSVSPAGAAKVSRASSAASRCAAGAWKSAPSAQSVERSASMCGRHAWPDAASSARAYEGSSGSFDMSAPDGVNSPARARKSVSACARPRKAGVTG